jgi:redox-sensitive bicupin YhaK (pirin superfamily)
MITIRRSAERGHASHGWLDTYHTFSFAGYYDPRFMGYRALRVINQDRVAPGRGFGMHPHDNMEIITVVLEGAIEHRDTMGFKAVLRPGEVQVISAGTGMAHGEANPSTTEPLHLLQIWIEPNQMNGKPAYQQRAFPLE